MCIYLDTCACACICVHTYTHMCVHPLWWSLSVCALRHSSGWRTGLQECRAGGAVVVVAQCVFIHHQGPPTCTRNPTQHSDALSLAPPQSQSNLTSLHPHVLATTAPLLPATCLPLRQQRPRRTGSVTHRVPEPAFGRAVHFLRRPPTSSRIDLVANQTAARHKHRLCRPQSVSLSFCPCAFERLPSNNVIRPCAHSYINRMLQAAR